MRPQRMQHGIQLAHLTTGMSELQVLLRQTLTAYALHSGQASGTPPAAGIGQPAQFIPACPDSVVVLESPCPISPTMPFVPSAGATRSQLACCVDLALAQGVQAEAMAISMKARAARGPGCHSPPRPRRSDRSRSPARNVPLVVAALSPPAAVLPARASCENTPVGFRGEGFPPPISFDLRSWH